MSIWMLIGFALVSILGFHAALFVWLLVRIAYGFLWSIVAYSVVVLAVLFILARISA